MLSCSARSVAADGDREVTMSTWTPTKTPHSVVPHNLGEEAMQRDMDLVREILLKIDEAKRPVRMVDLVAADASDDDLHAVQYHLAMLIDEVAFVSGVKAHTLAGKNWIELNLTWNGHEFLDNVRDPEIWRQTKTGAVKAGQWSIKTLAEIAVAIGKARIEQLFATGEIGG